MLAAMKRPLFALLIAFVVIVALGTFQSRNESAQQAAAAAAVDDGVVTINWMIGHEPIHYFLRAAQTFKDLVEERSHGEIVVNIILPETQDERIDFRDQARGMLESGAVDMMQAYTGTFSNDAKSIYALDTPLLFRDYRHIDAVLEGPVGESLIADIDTHTNAKALAFTFSGGYMSFVSSENDLASLTDLKNLRVPEQGFNAAGVLLGQLNVTPVPWEAPNGDKYSFWSHLTTGHAQAIEGVYNDAIELIDGGEPISILHSKHRVLFTVLAMNTDVYNSLTEEQQAIVREAAIEAARAERQEVEADEARLLSDEKYAQHVHELSESDRELLEDYAAQAEDAAAEVAGQDLIDAIKKEAGE